MKSAFGNLWALSRKCVPVVSDAVMGFEIGAADHENPSHVMIATTSNLLHKTPRGLVDAGLSGLFCRTRKTKLTNLVRA